VTGFAEILREVMTLDPLRAQIDFESRDYNWGELGAAVSVIAEALDALGLPPEARVGVILRNRPGHIAALAAVLVSGRCLVTLNPMQPDQRLAEEIAALGLPAVVVEEGDLLRPGLAKELTRAGCGVVAIGARLEGARLVGRGDGRTGTAAVAAGVAIEMLTSGTTGTPKRVPLTRAAFDASFAGFTAYERDRGSAEAPRLRSGVTMVVNPLTHIGGIYGCIGALLNGRKIALLERFTVEGWVDLVRRNRPRVAPAVPSAIRMLLDANVRREDLSSLSAIISGTAPLSADLVDAFLQRFGVPILGNYGATEFAGAVAGWTIDDFSAHWRDKRGAAGRIHANVRARVVDPDTGHALAHGEEGLLELRGDQLGPAHRLDDGAWLRTTDRVVLDPERFLFIMGRADNAIIRGGFKIHPEAIVQVLGEHPAVREAAVVGIPDDRLGSVPAAAVILRDGAASPDEEALKAWLRERLLPYQVPVRFRFVEDFPRTPSMKPSAPGLAELFAEPK